MVNVLIIDDDNQMRSLLREAFLLAEIEVETAADGFEAERIFASRQFKVVITDIVMPDKDGFEVIFEIKKNHPDTKVIAISGGGRLNATDYLESARSFGCVAVFQKPLNRKALIAKVKELLQS
jgi:DNA-binding NtrC family response regulator